MHRQFSEHRRRAGLKLQNLATNDGVECPFECRLGGIALEEEHVVPRLRDRSCPRYRQRVRRAAHTDNFAGVTDQVGHQE
jgi:hypothetical protein